MYFVQNTAQHTMTDRYVENVEQIFSGKYFCVEAKEQDLINICLYVGTYD